MKVSHRLLLTLLPAGIGVLVLVALAYWGQYARQAPHVAVLIAALTLAASAILALRQARYLANRIERLARLAPQGTTDELESIERSVEDLRTEVTMARLEGTRRAEHAEAERRELSALLSQVAGAAAQTVDEIRLPLHILLENRFGDLNENQEEMLGAAQQSAEGAASLLRRLRLTADLAGAAVPMRRDALRVDDIVRGTLPTIEGVGAPRGVRVIADVPPGLPRVAGDRTHLQEVVATVLTSAVRRTDDGGDMRITLRPDDHAVRLSASHGAGAMPALDAALVRLLAQAMDATVIDQPAETTLTLPLARPIV